MSYEGNYIDGLMSRKESIYTLLRAKIYSVQHRHTHPPVPDDTGYGNRQTGCTERIGWAVFVAGCVYFCLFQLAVYNNRTVDLNAKMTNRQNIGNRIAESDFRSSIRRTSAYEFYADNRFFGPTVTAWILIAIGAGFILTSRFWLKNVYHRFMKRRYKNMEGFRDSRQ